MKTYKTYQEAKIANPKQDIFTNTRGDFGGFSAITSGCCVLTKCNPSDYCMTIEEFLSAGYKFEIGDIVLDYDDVISIDTDGSVVIYNGLDARHDKNRYILSAAVLHETKVTAETPEEKEALDMIDTTSKQVESLANNSVLPNGSEVPSDTGWKNGDECIYMTHNVVHQFIGPCPKREGYGYIQAPGFEVNFVELSKLSKPESPEQKTKRERLEAAYDLYLKVQERDEGPGFAASFKQFQDGMMSTCRKDYLSIVDITGYRKESK